MSLAGSPPEGGIRALNVAPSRPRKGQPQWSRLPTVRMADGQRKLDALVWPLIPAWARGELPKYSTANCRSEPGQPFAATVSGKPTFRVPWKQNRRCLIPMSWFYEWDKRTQPSQPWRVEPTRDVLLVMAGLWDRSKNASGQSIESFTIITTGPNKLLREIGHDRAPVLLEPEQFETWLAGPPDCAAELLQPPRDGTLVAHKITRKVNNPDYDGDDLAPESRSAS